MGVVRTYTRRTVAHNELTMHNKGRQKGQLNEINLLLNTSTGRKALVSGQPLPSGHPLTYSTGGGRQLFVFVTLETAIHIIVLGDNL